ncbi:MAG: cbb3-type cytochrome oxidase assembly protein CcoS [Bacteroidota bacterium]
MSVIFILIGCSLLLATSFLVAFLWASKSGQFEDDYTPSVRILFDEGTITSKNNSNKSDTSKETAKSNKNKNSSIKT